MKDVQSNVSYLVWYYPGLVAIQPVIQARDRRRPEPVQEYHPPLDPGIEKAVKALRAAGIETFESCEGGEGHAYTEPTVRFHGEQSEGFHALSIALQAGLKVTSLRRIWTVLDQEPHGPWWEMTFAQEPAISLAN